MNSYAKFGGAGAAIFLLSAKNRWGAHMWPAPGRARVKTHMMQCQESLLVMYWHQSYQLSLFKSIAPRQVAFSHDFAEILPEVVPFATSKLRDLTWPDHFLPKIAQKMPHQLCKILAPSDKRCDVHRKKLRVVTSSLWLGEGWIVCGHRVEAR